MKPLLTHRGRVTQTGLIRFFLLYKVKPLLETMLDYNELYHWQQQRTFVTPETQFQNICKILAICLGLKLLNIVAYI